MSKYIITVAPPTPNGNLHLGHIAGPFLAADVFNKVMRLLKHETIFVCYSDDYQDYVVRKSLENSIDRFDWATKFADQIGATLEKTEIALDWFMKAYNNPYFKESVKFFYENACAKDNISTVNTSVPYSLEDDVYGYEAFARGTCNYCGAESDPSQCEECANSPNIEKMGELVSIISKKPMVFVEKEREFFKLGNYTDFLERLYRTSFARIELKEFVSNAIENCNLDWFIDRPDGNGIELTLHGTQKIIHTWFSGMAGYYAATQEYSESIGNSSFWREFWTSPETKIVNFLGFDCSFSHALVYPSLLSNIEGFTTNVTPITNRFLKLEGQDFSTSRGHAIWVDDILKEVSANSLRFYLALISPENVIKNFEKEKFMEWNDQFFKPNISLLTEFMGGNFVPSKEFSFDLLLDNQVLSVYKKKWKTHAVLENFSITKLAEILIDFLILIVSKIKSNEELHLHIFIEVYLVISSPIHTSLSLDLIERYGINKHYISKWLLDEESVSQY